MIQVSTWRAETREEGMVSKEVNVPISEALQNASHPLPLMAWVLAS